MHPPITLTSNTFALPLSQIYTLCNRLSCILLDKVTNSQQERLNVEQQLWNEIKKIRSLNDGILFEYLIGFYHTLLYQLGPPRRQDDLFYYHILIRLGDLSRYMNRPEQARFYYCNARNLFPLYGHAYNQLALLTEPNDHFKCCYNYARAAKSTQKPLNKISDGNLRIAVAQYNNELLSHVINEETTELREQQIALLPKTPYNWFFFVVLTTYVDNMLPIARHFLSHLNVHLMEPLVGNTVSQNGHKHKDCSGDQEIPGLERYPILLATLDVMVDWIKLGSQGKLICKMFGAELRQVKTVLQTLTKQINLQQQGSTSEISNSSLSSTTSTVIDMNQTRCSSSTSFMSTSPHSSDNMSFGSVKQRHIQPAMFHDYILRGYSPLATVHENLTFTNFPEHKLGEDEDYITALGGEAFSRITLIKLIERIRGKLDGLAPLLRKKTRNIALESILSRS